MLIRIALFTTLLALFYFYCKDNSSAYQHLELEDANMRDIPINKINPMINHNLATGSDWYNDSTSYFISTRGTKTAIEGQLLSSVE